MKLTANEIALVVNALREKANGDRRAAKEAGPIAELLEVQARDADRLAEKFEDARDVTVEV